jgi:hypothetical protein
VLPTFFELRAPARPISYAHFRTLALKLSERYSKEY